MTSKEKMIMGHNNKKRHRKRYPTMQKKKEVLAQLVQ